MEASGTLLHGSGAAEGILKKTPKNRNTAEHSHAARVVCGVSLFICARTRQNPGRLKAITVTAGNGGDKKYESIKKIKK